MSGKVSYIKDRIQQCLRPPNPAALQVSVNANGTITGADSVAEKSCEAVWQAVDKREEEGIAAALAGLLARAEWQARPVRLLLPADWCMARLTELPPGLQEAERQEAAYWEMADSLQESGMDAAQFAIASMTLPQEADTTAKVDGRVAGQHDQRSSCRVWLAALPQERLQAVRQAMAEADIHVVQLAASPLPPENWQAGAGREGRGCAIFWQQDTANWPRRRLIWLVAAAVLLCCGFWLGADLCDYYQAHTAAQQARQQLAALDTDKKAMAVRQGVEARVHAKTRQLSQLTAERQPWYAVLVHCGTMTTDGVWLDKLQLRQEKGGSISLQGEAQSYEALSAYLARFEQDKDFFPQVPLLEEAKQGDAGQIAFRLRLSLAEEK